MARSIGAKQGIICSLSAAGVVAAVVSAAVAVPPGVARDAIYDWKLPAWASPPPVPRDNAMSAAKVELGRRLFYDIRLSGPGYMSCATCHRQEKAFTDGRRVAVGVTGERHTLNTPGLANVGYAGALTLADPLQHSLEEQAKVPLFGTNPVEMGSDGHEKHILEQIAFNSINARLFQEAFPDSDGRFNFASVRKALAAFQRTLISVRSPYDRFRFASETDALSDAAQRGLKLFKSERLGCASCHFGLHLTDAIPQPAYHNTGLYNVDGAGGLSDGRKGLIEHTGRADDMGRFKTPSLRNVAVTAPYMHDGSLTTLDGVISHYAAGGNAARHGTRSPLASPKVQPFAITQGERGDLIAFLESLTDQQFLSNPAFASPFQLQKSER